MELREWNPEVRRSKIRREYGRSPESKVEREKVSMEKRKKKHLEGLQSKFDNE